MKRGVVEVVATVVLAGAAVRMASPPKVESASATTVELRQVDVGYAVGRPGLKARLTLATGEAVEYEIEDPAEGQAFLRLADLFVSGRARMFADLDGREVRGVHVSGPSLRQAQ